MRVLGVKTQQRLTNSEGIIKSFLNNYLKLPSTPACSLSEQIACGCWQTCYFSTAVSPYGARTGVIYQ